MSTETLPLFDLAPVPIAPAAPALSSRGLALVMAGRCALLDATTDPDGRDVVWLSADWASAFYGPAEDADPETVHQMLRCGQMRRGAPVVARLTTGAQPAHLVIGPFDFPTDDQGEAT